MILRPHRIAALVPLALLGSGAVLAAPADAARILYHEVVELAKPAASRAAASDTERLVFEAYGRRFVLLLEPNERLRQALKRGRSAVRPLRGVVEGSENSWVRLTQAEDGTWRGMIFDDGEVYAIEPAADVAEATVQPIDAAGNASIMFRLADMLLPPGAASCGTHADEGPTTALSTYEAISQELQTQAATSSPTRQLTVAVVADHAFSQHFTSRLLSPEQAIVSRMNIVDGIYSAQLSLKVQIGTSTMLGATDTTFTQNDAGKLLDELRRYRRNTSSHHGSGITHLMTGRDLNGDTVGIAYMGTVCDTEYGVSLSEGTRSTTTAALVAAHEIGHNFNAPHDGEGACTSTPSTFLMAPRLNGSDKFSDCSLQIIQSIIARSSCLATITPADAAVELTSSSVQATANSAFTLSFLARAVGGQDSTNVVATATLPSGFTLNSSAVTGGSCTSGAGTVSCSIGTLTPGEGREVSLNLTGQSAGSFNVNLEVTSANDASTANNAGQVAVSITNPAPPAPPNPVQTTSGDGGGGGGGRLDWALLLLLGGTLLQLQSVRRKIVALR